MGKVELVRGIIRHCSLRINPFFVSGQRHRNSRTTTRTRRLSMGRAVDLSHGSRGFPHPQVHFEQKPKYMHHSLYRGPMECVVQSNTCSLAMDFEFPGDMTWFKANLNGTGFYRVHYPASNWDALILALNTDHRVFTTADRAQLINDAFALAQ